MADKIESLQSWRQKFKIRDDDHCTVFVTMKAPNNSSDDTSEQIKSAIHTVVKNALEKKYYSAGNLAFTTANTMDPPVPIKWAKDAGRIAGIAALAAEDTPKEIAGLVHAAVTSMVNADTAETVYTNVEVTVKIPRREKNTHSFEISKPNLLNVMGKVCRAIGMFDSDTIKTTDVITEPILRTKPSRLFPKNITIETLLSRKSLLALVEAIVPPVYSRITVGPSESISKEEKTIVAVNNILVSWFRGAPKEFSRKVLADISADTFEEKVEILARRVVLKYTVCKPY